MISNMTTSQFISTLSVFEVLFDNPFLIIVHIIAIIGIISMILFGIYYRKYKKIRKQYRPGDKEILSNYRSLIENYNGMAYRCLNDEDWTMIYISQKAYELTGYLNEDIIHNHLISFEEIIHPEYRQYLRDKWNDVLINHEDFSEQYKIVTKKKEEKWVHETGHGVFDDAGNVKYIEGFIYDITRQKSTEFREKKSETRYKNIIENSQNAIYIDEGGVIVYANPACVHFFKAPNDQFIIGKKIVDLITPEYTGFYQERIERLQQTHLPNPPAEYHFKRYDGTIGIGEVSSSTFVHDNELSIHVFIKDITDSKSKDFELKKVQNRMHDLVTHMSEGISVFTLSDTKEEAVLNYCNTSFCKIMFHEEKDAVGMTFSQVFKNVSEEVKKQVFVMTPSTPTIIIECRHCILNHFLEIRFSKTHESELIVMVDDISTRKKAEIALIAEKTRLENIIASTETGTWEWDLLTGVISINENWAKILGYQTFEIGQYSFEKWKKLIHPEDYEVCMKELDKHLKGVSDIYHVEARMKHKNGNYVWILDRGAITKRDDNNQPIAMSGTHHDITHLKENERNFELISRQDYLTGLFNRRALDSKLIQFEDDPDIKLGIIMADVNGLKVINDAFGHLKGDELLSKVAEKIKYFAKSNWFVYRAGGDEFVVLCPNASKAEMEEYILNLENDLIHLQMYGIQTSVSFGYAIGKDYKEGALSIYNNAEIQMYNNKMISSIMNKKRLLDGIVQALYEKHPKEKQHAENVANLCFNFAKQLQLSEKEQHLVKQLGLVHDIGKIVLPREILEKPGDLSEQEYQQVKGHVEVGFRIISNASNYDEVAHGILSHHERWDGTGYPRGLKGDEIPIYARIIQLCEVYDVLLTERPYRKAFTKAEAIQEIKEHAGSQFDPNLTEIFIETCTK